MVTLEIMLKLCTLVLHTLSICCIVIHYLYAQGMVRSKQRYVAVKSCSYDTPSAHN